ncbi:MAG: hypothetical protein ABJO67_20835 [Pseudoruegeria sp.]
MSFLTAQKSKLFVVIALICAMASFGFAHRLVAEPVDSDMRAYIAAGGSLEDICGFTDAPSHQAAQSCEACRLVDAAVLSAYESACSTPVGKPTAVLLRAEKLHLSITRRDLTRAPRGPPAA